MTCTKPPPYQRKAQPAARPLDLRLTCLLGCFPGGTFLCRLLTLNSVLGLDLFGLFLFGKYIANQGKRIERTFLSAASS